MSIQQTTWNIEMGKVKALELGGGERLTLSPRLAGIIAELYERRSQIEAPRKGRLEITVDFSNGSFTIATREVGESKRLTD